MKIVLATLEDLDQIWSLRVETSKLLKQREIDQWQYKDPTQETFIKDILNEEFYVAKDENNMIIGMMSLKKGVETTYNIIYDGSWRFNEPYLTIHRLAVKSAYLGSNIAKDLMVYAEKMALSLNTPYIRIDTHERNKFAIRLFESFGYVYCGWINLVQEKGDLKRLAFDKKVGIN
ncbi:MAG: GNAT family N-acetyltransferase [Tenericutes bacterium HGW-Tenericutes-3]|nr:MAG: GNAT family N-acetyltransferase [Tenericutes bacterium HGW-Tenericutes-3]